MFINKASNGNNNICAENVTKYRINMGLSQRALADRLQIYGLDVDKNAIQRIECGKRFVTDIEMVCLSRALKCTIIDLLDESLIG